MQMSIELLFHPAPSIFSEIVYFPISKILYVLKWIVYYLQNKLPKFT